MKCQQEFILSRTLDLSEKCIKYICPKGYGFKIELNKDKPFSDVNILLQLDRYILKSFENDYCNKCQYKTER